VTWCSTLTDLSSWPALVLTAGRATRLRPLSDIRAKAAIPVAGQPIITRILRRLHAAGIRRVVVNLHHRPATITRLIGDGAEFGLTVRYSWEPVLLGSAGGPRHALSLLESEQFVVINGDTLTDCDLAGLVRRHTDSHARVTMALVPGDVARYGGAFVDDAGRIGGFGRPRAGQRALHFIGVQAVDAEVFAGLPDDQPAETVGMLYPQLIAKCGDAVAAFESRAEFLDVGTARDYLATVAQVARREADQWDIGQDCRIGASALLDRCILWDRVVIGDGARLSRCIIADGVHVAAGATHENVVLIAGPSGVTATPI